MCTINPAEYQCRPAGFHSVLSGSTAAPGLCPGGIDTEIKFVVLAGRIGYILSGENLGIPVRQEGNRMLRRSRATWLALFLSTSTAIYAQTGQGTVTGSVTDTTGAIIAGVSVVVKNQNTGFVYNAVTTQEGVTAPYLNVGTYEVTFSAAGFKKLARRDVPIRSSETLGLDVSLEIGNVVESVEVSAERSVARNRDVHNRPPCIRDRIDYAADARR